jgi:hypothetical protein
MALSEARVHYESQRKQWGKITHFAELV